MTGPYLHPRDAGHRPRVGGSAAVLLAAALLGACGSQASPPPSTSDLGAASAAPSTRTPEPSAGVAETQSPALLALEGRITFIRIDPVTGTKAVFVINADGSAERQLLPGNHECPTWSPDGKKILLTTDGQDGALTMAIVSADGADIRPLKIADATLTLGCGAWSPDGSHLALEGWDDSNPTRNGVYTVRSSDGGELVRVSSSPDGAHDIPGSYSPDGAQISFVRSTVPDHGTLYTVPAVGGSPTKFPGFDTFWSSWSRDGKSILADGQEGGLSLVSADDGSVQTIRLRSSEGAMEHLAVGCIWSPGGEHIACAYGSGVDLDVYTMLADGCDMRRLTDDPAAEEPGGWTR